MSEKTRGKRGILLRMPHFWLGPSSPFVAKLPFPIDVSRRLWSNEADLEGFGMSKTCRVDLSEVTASMRLDGEIDIEKMVAWSTPRRSSAMRAPVLVLKRRISVPCRLSAYILAWTMSSSVRHTYHFTCGRHDFAIGAYFDCSQC